MAIRRKRIHNVVGGNRHVHSSLAQLTNTGDAAPGTRRLGAAFDVEFGGRKADRVHARLLQEVNDLRPLVCFEHVERAQVAEHHSPLHAARDGLLGNVGTGEQGRVVRGIGVEVQRHVKSLGSIETPVDVAALVLVHIGAPAQHRQSHLQRFPQQALGHVVVEQAFLRKRHQLQVQHPGAFRLHPLQRLDPAQPHIGIDLHVRPHGRATMAHGIPERPTRTLINIVHREGLFQLRHQHLRRRPSSV